MRVQRYGVVVGLVMGFLLASCKGDELTGLAGVCDVTRAIQRITLTPKSDTIFFRVPARSSDSTQLTAAAFGRMGDLRTDIPFEFSSSDTSVLTVDAQGVVRAKSAGTAIITAKACDERATATVTAIAAVAQVLVVPSSLTLVEDDTALVTARILDQNGERIPDARATFSVSDPAIATVEQTSDTTAIVRALRNGTVTVTATSEGAQSQSTQTTVLSKRLLFVEAGADFSCGFIALGRGYCWGLGQFGQLGVPGDSLCFEENVHQPGTELPCAISPIRFGPELALSKVSAGGKFACGVTTDGNIYCWGDNSLGQLGNGNRGSPGPVAATVFTSTRFTNVSAGSNHACGIAVSGAGYCWGLDAFGQLGDARFVTSTTPIPIVGVSAFSQISAGSLHTCGLDPSGKAFCWGDNIHGELGTGNLGGPQAVPSAVSGTLTYSAIGAGNGFSCGLDGSGALRCWGIMGADTIGPSPTVIPGAAGPFTQLAVGAAHACVLNATGSALCVGSDADEQLGNGGAGSSSSLVPVIGGLTFTSITAGSRHTCALATDGEGYCWGSNVYGALGNELQAAFRGTPNKIARVR